MRKKKGMVGWFDPEQLVQTAIRVLISSLFGEFADRREAFAAANPINDKKIDERCDYSTRFPNGDLWLDYVADTADGWNPTYAVARLLAADELRPLDREGGAPVEKGLPRARVLVMGGDQVYPTATPEDYENRLIHPFQEAYRPGGAAPLWTDEDRPDLFAVPGNHDWYDGLKTFFHLFCRRTIKSEGEAEISRNGKIIGGRQTHQTRSYFALKLPKGWWLWGTDSQLAGYIDQPQVDFFQYVAQCWMDQGSKLILCTGTPDWEYVRGDKVGTYEGLSYLERLAPAVRGKDHQLKLVLSGDSHHYARFQEHGLNYITCGGGGAFLHPTHQLPKGPVDFKTRYPRPGETYDPEHGPYDRRFEVATKAGTNGEEALFPDRRTSSGLTFGNLLFAFRNWKLSATLAALYFFFIWLLDFNARVSEGLSMPEALASAKSYRASIGHYWQLAFSSPWSAVLLGLAGAAYYYFAEIEKTGKRILVGGAHALVHAALVTLVTCAVMRAMIPAPPAEAGLGPVIASMAAAAVASAILSATVIGLYLSFSLWVFGIHWGHFSSLAIQGYKSFLRLHIGTDGALTIHPIGLTKVPKDRGWPWSRNEPPRNPALEPHLIEPPIRIE